MLDNLTGRHKIILLIKYRGATRENKLGQSNLKAQFGGVRIQDWQNDVAALARDLFRAKVELFASKFSDQTLMAMTGLPQQEDQEQVARFPQVLQMFRSDMRTFRIDIETDSTIRADLTRSQEMFTAFLGGTAQFASAIGGLVQIAPQVIPTAIEVYTAFARKFKLEVEAGMIGINVGIPAPVAYLPFGGMKWSQMADTKAQGKAIIRFYTEDKVITERYWTEEG